ncbi:FAD-binding and (Fe-S)-binding domain-containing protein [Spongiivirga citrea]|uniref:FAD-binding protein n=1 Tax=Spongiivirga citrea TaxID=1481457 RepID=A0A6M0CF87_9FLAO|nr:FAD-binding and (Fe-S)-binding domain-containing protein [Spongiivirga citrea]NER16518.1 FAD-binding protein [Spongiivirga citrea]
MSEIEHRLKDLSTRLEGTLHYDDLHKAIYATDASVYRKIPTAIAYPKTTDDIKELIAFATRNKTSIIPRTAGTSLAGQCVGDGIIVDVSRHFTNILNFDKNAKTITVQPGIIRDELNRFLKEHGLFFGPNTSTSNRCMIGGMVGNNSSGSTSIKYGVTRDKVLSLKTIMADGTELTFGALSEKEYQEKEGVSGIEGVIHSKLRAWLSEKNTQEEILKEFPKQTIHRRNTGYAVDALLQNAIFADSEERFNMCKLLAGSEGTLAFTTEITLQLDDLPLEETFMVAAHFNSIDDCMQSVVHLMKHDLYTCEMMDRVILDCTKNNTLQAKNRFFVNGDPKAILLLEVRGNTKLQCEAKVEKLLVTLKKRTKSYANPILYGEQIDQAFELRQAGLGLLGNMVGDKKAVACIEDTAVAIEDLADYIYEFSQIMKKYDQDAVYYAHAGAGEIHLRPILNLKKSEDVTLFRKITTDVAHLVKKYKGSMSGEHGDGIVRAEFIEKMIGSENYQLLRKIKYLFDPNNILNPGKIVDPFKMDEDLRYQPDRPTVEIDTILDFSDSEGIVRLAEKCNGSGDCRKTAKAGGTMCPSYRATLNEKDTTRARANALREFLTNTENKNKFDQKELKEVFDLCLSCKACASECPSNVDVASLKAEFQYQYQKVNGKSLRSKLFAYNDKMNRLGSTSPWLYNTSLKSKFFSGIVKKSLRIAEKRSLPLISSISLEKYIQNSKNEVITNKKIYLFIDEFSNFLDTPLGIDAYHLLTDLGYEVCTTKHRESGRAMISKGYLKEAKTIANKNVSIFKDLIAENVPLVGIEPSAILTFKDEYLRLADDKEAAKSIAENTLLIDEFLDKEIQKGAITSDQFTEDSLKIKFHGHCHQKALANQLCSFNVLNLPKNYTVTIIPSGCCGMAGSFGYEKEHYDISIKVGEQTLFPAVRKTNGDTIIAATGTSCRHQIKDGTDREALHPVTILRRALKTATN